MVTRHSGMRAERNAPGYNGNGMGGVKAVALEAAEELVDDDAITLKYISLISCE